MVLAAEAVIWSGVLDALNLSRRELSRGRGR